jgi:hypothetical protein
VGELLCRCWQRTAGGLLISSTPTAVQHRSHSPQRRMVGKAALASSARRPGWLAMKGLTNVLAPPILRFRAPAVPGSIKPPSEH